MKRLLCLFPLALLCLFSKAATAFLTPVFTYVLDQKSCPPKATFNDVSTGGAIANRTWHFGDGATGTGVSVVHEYATAGVYTVKLVLTDSLGQKDSTSQAITIAPEIRYLPLRDTSVMEGPVRLWSRSNAETYTWSNGDTTATTEVAQSGTHTVTLSRCGTVVVDSVFVDIVHAANVGLQVIMPADVCSRLVRFKAVCKIPGDSIIATYWTFGDFQPDGPMFSWADTARFYYDYPERDYQVTCRAYLSDGITYFDFTRTVRFDKPLQPVAPEYYQGSCSTPSPLVLDAGNDRIGASYYWHTWGETTQKIAMPYTGTHMVTMRDQCNNLAVESAHIYARVQLPKPVLYWTGYALRLQPINFNYEYLVKWYRNGTLFYTGGGPTEGEPNPLYYSFDPGTYKVVISAPRTDCQLESDPYVQNVIIPRIGKPTDPTPEEPVDKGLGKITVFPNPGNGLFRLQAEHAPVNRTIYTVTDIHGKQVLGGIWLGNPQEIDLQSRPNGVYILKVENQTFKLIKQ